MLREKRDTDLMRIRSILPCLHLRIIFMNSGRFSALVPVNPLSAKMPTNSHSGFFWIFSV